MEVTHHKQNARNAVKVIAACGLFSLLTATMTLHAAQGEDSVPRTATGAPDLQGLWDNVFVTPLERPEALGEKSTYTEEEAREVEKIARQRDHARSLPISADREPPPVGAISLFLTDLNFIPELASEVLQINGEYRTSLIVKPANGRLPVRQGARDFYEQLLADGHGEFDGPEIRPVGERCLVYGSALPNMSPLTGRIIQIVQTDDYVVLLTETGYQARIIRLNSEHQASSWNLWMGDSVGHWEEDTLVVHTQNFRPEQTDYLLLRTSDELEVTEYFTLTSDNELIYSYTATDLKIYNEPFTVEMGLRRMPENERLYESACHEGNYALKGIFTGARVQEQDNK